MDVLSDAVAAMRTGQPHSARTERRGPWSVAHPSFGGVGFHVVLTGLCRLIPPVGEPIRLGAGDAVFLPHGSPHALADAFSAPSAEPPLRPLVPAARQQAPGFSGLQAAPGPGPERRVPPAAGPDGHVVMLCGGYLLDCSRLHPLMNDLPDVLFVPSRRGSPLHLRGAIDLLAAEIERPRPGADAVLPALLDALLVFMFRFWFDEQRSHDATGWAAAFRDPVVMPALAAMHGDPSRGWTVAELASVTGLSRAAFARRFAAVTGSPPLAYLTWWRMTTAARLLRASAAPLGAVASQVGYASEYSFAAAFKREYGIAPGRYRSRVQPVVA